MGSWTLVDLLATGRRVGVGPDGAIFLIGMDQGVYRLGEGRLTRLGLATGKELSIGPAGEVAIVGTDDGVYVHDGHWRRLGGGSVRLAVWLTPVCAADGAADAGLRRGWSG